MPFPFRSSTFACLALAVFCLFGAVSARAQILLTFSGTATNDAHGYVFEQSYTVSFQLNSAFSGQLGSNSGGFDGESVSWWQSDSGQTPVFTDIYGSALQGSFIQPTNEPDISLALRSAGRVEVYLGTGDGASLGLLTLDGESPTHLGRILIQVDAPFAATANYSGSYTNPASYWSNLLGTHAVDGQVLFSNTSNQSLMTFNATSLTVTDLAAVPEPASAVGVAGLAALGIALWRRRTRAARSRDGIFSRVVDRLRNARTSSVG